MRRLKMGLLLALSVSFVNQVQAADLALSVGTRQNSVQASQAGVIDKSMMGYQFGGLAFLPLTDTFSIRSGFLYTKINYKLESTTVAEYDFNYFNIPLTGYFKFSDFGGVFAGPVLSINLTDDCTLSSGASCAASGAATTMLPLSLGATFKFAPQMGGEIYLEVGSGDIADSAKNYRAVGANLLITFE